MVLEYVDGSTLLDVIRNPASPLTNENKVDFHNQLLSGLSHVHSFGLSHGDLSLLNVHVTKHYQTLKILDFGRSTINQSYTPPAPKPQPALPSHPSYRRKSSAFSSGYSTPTLQIPRSTTPETQPPFTPEEIHPGTRPFTAPEILRGECTDALLADAYSLGIILLCLDLGNLVDVDQAHQRQDGEIETSACELFGERVGWYTRPWRERRRVKAEDRIG